MGYFLLWIESLAVGLLMVATLVACIGRVQRRWVRIVLNVLAVLMPLAFYVGLAIGTGTLQIMYRIPGARFAAMVLLTVAFAVGTIWLLVNGFRRGEEDPARRRAAGWPRGKLAVSLGVAVALHVMTFWNMDLAIRQEVAALRIEAGALALSVAPVRVPDADNAALPYQQAFELMGSNRQGGEAWKEEWNVSNPEFDAQDPKLREFLGQHTSTLALLRQGAAKPGCCFERDYGRPSISIFFASELHRLRAGARLLAADARCKAADGDLRGALENTSAMFSIAEHTASDPLVVMQLVAIAIDQIAIGTLEAVLASGTATAEDLAAANIHDHLSYRKQLEKAFRLEEAFWLSIVFQMMSGTGGPVPSGNEWLPFQTPGVLVPPYRVFLLKNDVATYRDNMRQLTVLAGKPYYETKEEWEALEQKLGSRPQGILSKVTLSALTSLARAIARGEAQRGVARVGLAMCRYRAAKRAFPETLQELVPEFIPAVPRDPFDGQPLRLKSTEQELVIYSIGPNGEDDGGVPFDKEEQTGDITFRLTR